MAATVLTRLVANAPDDVEEQSSRDAGGDVTMTEGSAGGEGGVPKSGESKLDPATGLPLEGVLKG